MMNWCWILRTNINLKKNYANSWIRYPFYILTWTFITRVKIKLNRWNSLWMKLCIEINRTTVKKEVRMKKIQFLIKKNLLAIVKPIQYKLASPNYLQRSISILFLKFKFLSFLSKSKRTVIRWKSNELFSTILTKLFVLLRLTYLRKVLNVSIESLFFQVLLANINRKNIWIYSTI